MILKALYDYYHRCGNVPKPGMEDKQIGFIIVIDTNGQFKRIEDCRINKNTAKSFRVKKSVGRTSAPVANYLYDNSAYVLGYSDKENGKDSRIYFDTFKAKINFIAKKIPDNTDINSVKKFYNHTQEEIIGLLSSDPLWEDVKHNSSKKYSFFSFRIEGDTKIVAEKEDLLLLNSDEDVQGTTNICLVTGLRGVTVETTTATMIPQSQATAKLVSFQVNSGYDSYGKKQAYNSPISTEAEFAYTTALNIMLAQDSRNKFSVGNRTFLFWASSDNEVCRQTEESIYNLFGFSEPRKDTPNAGIDKIQSVFNTIYTGKLKSTAKDKFFILGLAPNAARIAIVFWSETTILDFACKILKHFEDMEIIDNRTEKRPYMGLKDILSCVTLGGKQSEATPNLPDAVVKSIFLGLPYPQTLFTSCIRRIRAEQDLTPYNSPCRMAVLKACINRSNNKNEIKIMLDTKNTNKGYLCGRLFAVIDRIQEKANGQHGIQERYMNAASATPSAVFATILNLSSHHAVKLDSGLKVYFEKLKQEIISGFTADGFPTHLDLQDQGRFFIGFYHQRQDFFSRKQDEIATDK